ncbi:tyrosine-type recombinase/integrase [Fluviibacter phosphoraccumulans]|uniref:tyrosine-type recombinase/integrase n=1 Tax=Fluviibacter phosphoraccumulans TaxID=1751046 RepID=UPI0010BBEA90|nr:integrase arm-type DNA-binding domain-containing protein [Fluviibacter phosphoraccumulans]BCA66013.1 integrase [Fluviibacter phosphoraccumulans]
MALTDRTIRAAKPAEKQYKLSDAGGLYLLVTPAGGKLFRFKYRFDSKEKMLAIGIYPDIGLAEARERHAEARKLLARGVDPSAEKKHQKNERKERAENSFKVVALEWYERQKPSWTEKHAAKILARLENDVFKMLGAVPVADVDAPAVLKVLRKIEERQAFYYASRVRQTIGQVMRYAVATGRTRYDPVPALKDALTTHVEKHMAAVTDPKRVGELLKKFDDFTGTHTVGTALQLAPLIFGRMGELRQMKWVDLDLVNGLWSIPSASMKMREPHIVPLSVQAIQLIKGMEPLSAHLDYVFPSRRNPLRPMSENTINVTMRRLGIDTQEELTGHGFRATARTILHERLGYNPDWIEAQLSHRKRGPLGSAYDRTIFLEQRIGMMQAWADYLDQLKK